MSWAIHQLYLLVITIAYKMKQIKKIISTEKRGSAELNLFMPIPHTKYSHVVLEQGCPVINYVC